MRNPDNYRRWREQYREKERAFSRQRYAADPEKTRKRTYQWRERNRELIKERQSLGDSRRRQELRTQMFVAYGQVCACCGETEKTFLGLDHVNGGGSKERKSFGTLGLLRRLSQLGWPKNGYRILCMNCNFATRFGKSCPHSISTAIGR